MRNLIAAIIYRAVADYKKCKEEVREFFQSNWGKNLCEMIELSAKDILYKLENNLINYAEVEKYEKNLTNN